MGRQRRLTVSVARALIRSGQHDRDMAEVAEMFEPRYRDIHNDPGKASTIVRCNGCRAAIVMYPCVVCTMRLRRSMREAGGVR